jgi:predicted dehydrogenase
VEPNQYVLLDDDAKTCRIIGDDEFNASYVEQNIKSYVLDGIETWPAVPNPDNHNVILTYTSGSTNSIALNSISLDPGPAPAQYYKTGGIIIPIDETGNALFDATNTPNLTYIRNQYWDMARRLVENNLFMAEMVATFASAVAGGGNQNASGLTDYTAPGAVD